MAASPPGELPHAVFAVSDIMALGVIDALRRLGFTGEPQHPAPQEARGPEG